MKAAPGLTGHIAQVELVVKFNSKSAMMMEHMKLGNGYMGSPEVATIQILL